MTETRRCISMLVAVCFLAMQVVIVLPVEVRADAAQDLKTIEYKHYFRGNYEKAISELRMFLQRDDLDPTQVTEAREYLAASLILTGNTEQGKAQFAELLKADAAYKGPDPSVFKSVIVATYEEARAEYASTVIRTVPPEVAASAPAQSRAAGAAPAAGKPFYKKWWFYATMGVVVLAIAGAAGKSDEGSNPPAERGTVTVEVDVP